MRESELFQELQKIASQHGITVSIVNLKKYSYAIQSGMCKVEGEYRIFIDRHLHLSEKIDVLIDALQNVRLDIAGMSPELQRLFERRSAVSEACRTPHPAAVSDG